MLKKRLRKNYLSNFEEPKRFITVGIDPMSYNNDDQSRIKSYLFY